MTDTEGSGQLLTYAIWGSGDLDPRNAEALMGTYLPDPEAVGFVYRPDKVLRDHKGLRVALDWLERPDYAGTGGVTPSVDLLADLKDARDKEGDHVVLVALWPDAPTREDFAFVRAFQAEGINVVDLCRALDELDLTLYTEPPPPKEPKPEKAPAKPRPRKPKLSDAVDAPVTEEVPAAEVTPSEDPLIQATLEEMNIEAAMVAAFGLENARLIDDYVNYKIRAAMVHRTEPIAGMFETSSSPRLGEAYVDDTTPFDGPYVGTDTVALYSDKEGNLRLAEGKPRRGELVINLGPLELEVAKKEGRYHG